MPEKRSRVLVVEDDPEMLALVCEHLEAEGYNALSTSRGIDAIARLRSAEFDVVLTDLKMPDVDGLEVLRIARENHPEIPVIFPNRESALRLIGALLMEQDEKWASGRKYLDMTEYLTWQQEHKSNQKTKVTRIG